MAEVREGENERKMKIKNIYRHFVNKKIQKKILICSANGHNFSKIFMTFRKQKKFKKNINLFVQR